MRATLLVIVVTLASLGFTSAVVWGRDSTVLVPPPEAVVEQFARQLAARRYDRALQYVDEASKVSPATVRARGDELHERAGAIDLVEGRQARLKASTPGQRHPSYARGRRRHRDIHAGSPEWLVEDCGMALNRGLLCGRKPKYPAGEVVSDLLCQAKLLLQGAIGRFRAASELVRALEVQRQLMLETAIAKRVSLFPA